MKNTILLILLCVLIATPALAAQDLAILAENIGSEVEGQSLPGPLATLFGNQRINNYITMLDGNELIVSVITENGIVTKVATQEDPNPTLKVTTTEATIQKVITSDNPLPLLQNALLEGEIQYTAIGFFNKIKFGFTSVVAKLFGGFAVSSVNQDTTNVDSSKKEETNEPERADVPVKEIVVKKTEKELDTIEEPKESVHVVEMTNKGFNPKKLTIKAGDTVVWELARSKPNQGMIIGTQKCVDVRSKIFTQGSFEYTFNEPRTCIIVDGIMTTQTMTIDVE